MSKANAWLYLPMTILVMAVCSPLRAADDQVRVVPASELEQWWQVAPGHELNLGPQRDLQGCVAVAFEIHGDGTVSNERIWNPSSVPIWTLWSVTNNALQLARQWRFVPAPTNKTHAAIYTYASVTYTLGNGFSRAQLDEFKSDKFRLKCEVPDFVQQVQAMINSEKIGSKP